MAMKMTHISKTLLSIVCTLWECPPARMIITNMTIARLATIILLQ